MSGEDQRSARPTDEPPGGPSRAASAHSEVSAGRARPARSETSGASYRTSMTSAGRARPARDKRDQRGARPVARATGRARPARDERDQRGARPVGELPDERDQRETSGDLPARRDQWRELPDEPGASGSARRPRTEANQSSGEAPEGRARAERAKLRVTPGTSGVKEFEDGRKRQATLRRSCPLRR